MFFFFFQAEDGIRDHCMTGVQTCALPIYARVGERDAGGADHLQRARDGDRPRQGARRRGIGPAPDEEVAGAPPDDLRGTRPREADAGHDRGLRAREGRALRRPRRDGPGSPVEALRAGANMPARMPHRLLMLLCLLVLATGAAACGEADVEQGVAEPAREGLALEFEGIEYNVFITRQLNTRIPPDNAYVDEGTEPDRGETLYGVFIQTCNRSDDPHETIDGFKIVDNQGNEFEPEELPEDNQL